MASMSAMRANGTSGYTSVGGSIGSYGKVIEVGDQIGLSIREIDGASHVDGWFKAVGGSWARTGGYVTTASRQTSGGEIAVKGTDSTWGIDDLRVATIPAGSFSGMCAFGTAVKVAGATTYTKAGRGESTFTVLSAHSHEQQRSGTASIGRVFSDNFNRANGAPGGSWTVSDATISSNALTGTTGSSMFAYPLGQSAPIFGDFWSSARITNTGDQWFIHGLYTGANFYVERYSGGSFGLRYDDGVSGQATRYFSLTWTSGDSLGIRKINGVLEAWHKPAAGAWT
jgi:hypothetical protein